ncbi:MAG: CBS domain-containing protein [Bacteroidota bacterium]
MTAEELINHMIPAIRPSDTAATALSWMEEYRCSQLPVVDQEKFIGFITEEQLREANDRDIPVSELPLIGEHCITSFDSHFFEVLRTASDHKLQMVAVENNLRLYTGVISISDGIAFFAQSAAVQMPGSILVLSLEMVNYSLAEIARLVEENKAKILSSTLSEDPLDSSRIRLTIKVDQADLTRIVATLERFDYKIVARYQETRIPELDRDRFDLFMRYLNI